MTYLAFKSVYLCAKRRLLKFVNSERIKIEKRFNF